MIVSRSLVVLATFVALVNLTAGCSRTDAKPTPALPALAAAELAPPPSPPAADAKPFAPAEPEPQPTPEEVKAFNARVNK
jgi:hypothetical protein